MSVYLTIDVEFPDRSANADDAWREILAALERHSALATLFVQGKWAEAYPDRIRQLRDAGHLIGLHSYWHAAYSVLSDAGIREDLERGGTALSAAAGIDPRPWFRLPYGRGADEPRITELLSVEGYAHVDWTLDPADWHQRNDAEGVAGFLEREAPADDHPSVVLLHSWPRATPVALDRVLTQLGDRDRDRDGTSFRRLDDLPWIEVTRLTERGRKESKL